jgi:hypothetical protein
MRRRHFPLAFVLAGLSMVASCQVQNGPSRVELISGVRSNLSQSEIKSLTVLGNYRWQVPYDSIYIPPADSSHKRRWTGVRIDGYVELGVKGVLCLSFENDKLVSTFFYPTDLKAFLTNLTYVRGTKLTAVWTQSSANGVIVGWGRNPDLGDSVFWHDATLVAESDAWIARYE